MTHPVYAKIDGPVVLIGYGSIGRGTLPLIERHFDFDRSRLVIVEPNAALAGDIAAAGYRHVAEAVTQDNYRDLLGALIEPGKGFVVNLSVDTSSLDLIRFCREMGVLYIDTVVEPWAGYYFGTEDNAARTNYALRQAMRDEKAANPGGTSICRGVSSTICHTIRIAQTTGWRNIIVDTEFASSGAPPFMAALTANASHCAAAKETGTTRRKTKILRAIPS